MSDTTPVAKAPKGIRHPTWMRVMRLAVAAAALFMLFLTLNRFRGGGFPMKEAWILGVFSTLGISALVEAIWPEGNHLLLQFWCLMAFAASGLMSWAAGGGKWLGLMGAALMVLGLMLAVWSSSRGLRRARVKE